MGVEKEWHLFVWPVELNGIVVVLGPLSKPKVRRMLPLFKDKARELSASLDEAIAGDSKGVVESKPLLRSVSRHKGEYTAHNQTQSKPSSREPPSKSSAPPSSAETSPTSAPQPRRSASRSATGASSRRRRCSASSSPLSTPLCRCAGSPSRRTSPSSGPTPRSGGCCPSWCRSASRR